MNAKYLTENKRITIEIEGANVKEIFKNIGAVQEALDAEQGCGMPDCGCTKLHFQVRNVEGNEFYELVCAKCNARFEFGQHKKTPTLFPKRRDNGKPLPNGGWSKYDPAKDKDKAA